MWWFNKKKYNYCSYYIVLNGEHNVPILGIKGIGLKKVSFDVCKKHKGLKYWIISEMIIRKEPEETLKQLSMLAREDIMSLIMGKPLRGIKEIEILKERT